MREIKTIIIHHSGNTDTVDSIRNLHININKWDDIGYHFIISKDGDLTKGRGLDIVGAHVKYFNKDSIGVCLLGNFDKENIKEKQLNALKNLTNNLMKEFGLTKENIKFHRDFPNVTKSCPGNNIDKDLILKFI